MTDRPEIFIKKMDSEVSTNEWKQVCLTAKMMLENRGGIEPTEDAINRLAEILRDIGNSISIDAIGCSKYASKSTLTKEDIDLALSFSFI